MPYLSRLLVSILLALVLGVPGALAGSQSGASACDGCCTASQSSCASVCAPGAPAAQTDEQSSSKPLGAWYAGVLPAPFIAPVYAVPSATLPSRSPGPPRYLAFQSFLL